MVALPERAARVSVVMAGPLPPAIGGMTTVICDLAESKLRESFALELFDTAKQTRAGRSLCEAIGARLALWRRWWALMRNRGDRIAHIHTCSGLTYFLDGVLVLLARARGAPVVLHIHGGHFDVFLDRLNPVLRSLARAIARAAARVIVLSEGWRERLKPRLPGACLVAIENGVPLHAPAQPRTASGLETVLFLGAVCRAKGVEDLVRAGRSLPRSARVELVGPETEAGLIDAMRSLIDELGLQGQIEFVGPAYGADKAQRLAGAAVLVLPSHVEGLPVSILEAMAAGVPVVATRVGAIPSVIEDEVSGLLVAPGDIDALARALERLLRDAELRERLARRAFDECRQRFSIDRVADRLGALYAELRAPSRAGGVAVQAITPMQRRP